MATKDNRDVRAWVKVQLPDTDEAHQTAQIVKGWKSKRGAALHLMKAIRLYSALMMGDTRLLREYFPLVNVQQSGTADLMRDSHKPTERPKKRVVQKSEEEDLDDFLSLLK